MNASPSRDQVLSSVREVLSRRILDRAVAATDLCERLLLGFGPLRREDDRLFAGDHDLARERRQLQHIARATGLGINIYLGHRRIANGSVLEAGAPPDLGEMAPAPLIEQVSRRRNVFSGEVIYGDRPYLCAARPLGGTEHQLAPVGMVEAYQDKNFLAGVLDDLTKQVLDDRLVPEAAREDALRGASSLIDHVSRRLQLLALNGNILASQAGVHGRAFRVVCREMSNLGSQARKAAHDIRSAAEDGGDGGDGAGR